MEWLQKKNFIIVVILTSVVFMLLEMLPLYHISVDYVDLYRQAFVESFPRIELDDSRLTFLDPVPVNLVIDNKVEIICEKEPDLDYFNNTEKNSVLISEELLAWKSETDYEIHYVKDLQIDNDGPVVIEPLKVSQLINKYSKIVLGFAFALVFVLYTILVLLGVLVGGGIGFMIDAFHEGNITYTFWANVSSLLFFIYQFVAIVLYKPGVPVIKNQILFFIVFLLLMALLTVVIRKIFLKTQVEKEHLL